MPKRDVRRSSKKGVAFRKQNARSARMGVNSKKIAKARTARKSNIK